MGPGRRTTTIKSCPERTTSSPGAVRADRPTGVCVWVTLQVACFCFCSTPRQPEQQVECVADDGEIELAG